MDKLQLLLVLKCQVQRPTGWNPPETARKNFMISDIVTEDKESMEAEFERPVKLIPLRVGVEQLMT